MTRAPRGFTLLELMVGATVAIFVIAAVTATFLAQNRAFIALDLTRVAADSARDAFLDMEPSIRRAGFGLDPRWAFDFRYYACTASPCRDSITGADNLVFFARNPNYLYTANGSLLPDGTTCNTAGGCASGNAYLATITNAGGIYTVSVNLRTGATTPLLKGQVVQFVCSGNTQGVTMSTLNSTPTQVVNVTLSIVATPGAAPQSNDPTKQNAFASNSCLTTPNSVVMVLVDRYHYLIQAYNGVPWLVLDTGRDENQNGTTPENGADLNDYIPIAQGVEDLQFAYVLNINAPAVASGGTPPSAAPGAGPDKPTAGGVNSGNWVIGDYFTGSGSGITGQQEEPDWTIANMPLYTTPLADPLRFNTTAANIRAVRVTVNLRSTQTDQSQVASWTGDTEKRMENLSAASLLSGGRFRRFSFSSTVACRDMESRSNFVF